MINKSLSYKRNKHITHLFPFKYKKCFITILLKKNNSVDPLIHLIQ